MKKRIIAILLTLAMILVMAPAAFAVADPVAKIGDTPYTTLQEAIDVGGEITLLKDVDIDTAMATQANTTLNLNGHTVTVANAITVAEGHTLKITGDGNLVIDATVQANGTLDISTLGYGQSGLIGNRPGSLNIGAAGTVKLMNVWAAYSPNWLDVNSDSFFGTVANGAKVVLGTDEYTYNTDLAVWLKDDAVAVATINGIGGLEHKDGFASLADAVAAAKTGTTITLLDDIAITAQQTIDVDNVTLDGTGHTIYVADDAPTWSTDPQEKHMLLVTGDNVTVQNVAVDGKDKDNVCGVHFYDTTGTIRDLKIQNVKSVGLNINASDVDAFGKLIFGTGENANGSGNGVNVSFGENISSEVSSFNASAAEITGVAGIFADAEDLARAEEAEATITIVAPEGWLFAGNEETGIVWAPAETFAAQGYEAAIGTTPYPTLAAAIAAADEGDTITLLKDVEIASLINVPGTGIAYTIDGAGYTISGAGLRFIGENVSLKDIVFEGCSGGDWGIVEYGNCVATVTDCVFQNNTAVSAVAVDTSTGDPGAGTSEIEVSGCTFNGNEFSVAAVYAQDGKSNTVKNCDFTGNSVDIAPVYVGGGDATITGCYFSGNEGFSSSGEKKASVLAGPYSPGNNAVVINGNVFMDECPGVFAEDWSETYSAINTFNLNNNYWGDGESPEEGTDYGTIREANVTVSSYASSYTKNEVGVSVTTYAPPPVIVIPPTTTEPVTPPAAEAPSVDTSAPVVDSTTTENADGSTTKTETLENGAVVETTTNTDGSKTETATKTETTETEESKTTTTTTTTTTTDASGAVVKESTEVVKEEKADGSSTVTSTTVTESETKTEKTEVKEETVVKEDGTTETKTTSTTETAAANGSTGTTTVDETGKIEAQVEISAAAANEAAQAETAIELPMPAVPVTKDSEAAPTVTVSLPTGTTEATVTVPVEDVTAGTVAVIVNADGTETVITESIPTEDGLEVNVPDGATLKIVDNSTDFEDVDENDWFGDAVAFASARGIMNGMTETEFDHATTTTRAMVWTMLARLSGVDTTPADGESWYAAGQKWAMENGVSDGTMADGEITREQLATMLHRLVGKPASDHDISNFDDHHETSDWALEAKQWAVENGIINGDGNSLNPTEDANRAQVAQIFMNFITGKN